MYQWNKQRLGGSVKVAIPRKEAEIRGLENADEEGKTDRLKKAERSSITCWKRKKSTRKLDLERTGLNGVTKT